MYIIIVPVPDLSKVPSVLGALEPVVPQGTITLYESKPLPQPPSAEDVALEALAKKVADAIRPTAKQPMRIEAIRAALGGWDTFHDQEGEVDPALRNALGALSKAMKQVFPNDSSPIERIATRKRFSDKGGYLGTRYHATPLGVRVRKILEADGSI
jgi:hypothetical protein